jgi:hypothetical protein
MIIDCANVFIGHPAAGLGDHKNVSRIYDAVKRAQSERAATKRDENRVEFERRRDKRVPLNVPVFVYGRGARNEPFHEETNSLVVNSHGALLILSSKVNFGQELWLMNPLTRHEQACRVVRFGKKTRKRAEVAIAFTEPAPAFWSRSNVDGQQPESPK